MPLTGDGAAGGGPPSADRASYGGPVAGDGVRRWHADLAWLPAGGGRPGVLIEAAGERFVSVLPDVSPGDVPAGTVRLPGLTLPGLANAHSHAFHRALRGAAQAGQGTFWTWRERMYQVAARLEPDSYLALARAVYAEMAMAGIACVGEFHYLGIAEAFAAAEAAAEAGIAIVLLHVAYERGGLDRMRQPSVAAYLGEIESLHEVEASRIVGVADFRRLDAARVAVEQAHAEPLLQCLDLGRDHARSQFQVARRRGEPAQFHDPDEGGDLIEPVHRRPSGLRRKTYDALPCDPSAGCGFDVRTRRTNHSPV